MIGKIDRDIKLTIVYAANDRQEEANASIQLARGEQARFCNPKYFGHKDRFDLEADAKRVLVLPNSPNLDAILSAYAEAGIPAEVAGGAAPPPAPPAPEPAPVAAAAPAPEPPPADAQLPPWPLKTPPGKYRGAAKADLARQYVEAGRPEG